MKSKPPAMTNNHSELRYPHEPACSECRTLRLCNVCGSPATIDQRCTNGRCGSCHSVVCTSGGATDSGHGFGERSAAELQAKRAQDRRTDHA